MLDETKFCGISPDGNVTLLVSFLATEIDDVVASSHNNKS